MSKKRYIDTKFWDDSFVKSLSPNDRLLFLYFITNPLTELSGIYEITINRICFDTGLEEGRVRKGLEALNGKIYFHENWIFIKNFEKHQCLNENMKKGIERSKLGIPKEIVAKFTKINEGFGRVRKGSEGFGILKPKLKPKLKLKPNGLQADACGKYSFQEKIEKMLKSQDARMPIVVAYWQTKNIIAENEEQFKALLLRELRSSKILKGYNIQKIKATMEYLEQKANFKWTLETVFKYINEDLEKLSLKNLSEDEKAKIQAEKIRKKYGSE